MIRRLIVLCVLVVVALALLGVNMFQVTAAVTCLMGAVYQFGAHRAPEVYDPQIISSARKITGVSLMVAAAVILYQIYLYGDANPVLCIVSGLFGLGQILFGIATLQPEWKEKDYGYSKPGDLRQADGSVPSGR